MAQDIQRSRRAKRLAKIREEEAQLEREIEWEAWSGKVFRMFVGNDGYTYISPGSTYRNFRLSTHQRRKLTALLDKFVKEEVLKEAPQEKA